jgi:hypothetical protein
MERSRRADPYVSQVKPITFLESLKSAAFRLWDEQRRKTVGYP